MTKSRNLTRSLTHTKPHFGTGMLIRTVFQFSFCKNVNIFKSKVRYATVEANAIYSTDLTSIVTDTPETSVLLFTFEVLHISDSQGITSIEE